MPESVAYCGRCGSWLDPDAKICYKCGAGVSGRALIKSGLQKKTTSGSSSLPPAGPIHSEVNSKQIDSQLINTHGRVPMLMQESRSLERASYSVGGSGVILWGVSLLILTSALIYGITAPGLSNTFGSATTTLTRSQELIAAGSLIFIALFLVFSVFLIATGGLFLAGRMSKNLIFSTLGILSIVFFLLGIVFIATGSDTSIGTYLTTSGLLALIGGGLYLTDSLGAKVAGAVLGVVSAVLFSIVVGQIITSLNQAISSTTISTDLTNVWASLSGATVLMVVSIFVGVGLLIALPFFSPKSKVTTALLIAFCVAPMMFAIGLTIGGFTVGNVVGQALSAASSSGTTAPGWLVFASWLIIISGILAGVAGILALVGSGLSIGHLASSLRSTKAMGVPISVSNRGAVKEETETSEATASEGSTPLAKFCPGCGTKLLGDEAFCRYCGKKI